MTKEQKDKIRKSNLGKSHGSNEKNPKWKGDKVGYVALHAWIKRKLGRQNKCYICSKETNSIDLANISGIYDRNFSNWTFLCRDCHNKFDCRKSSITSEELISFENWVVETFNDGKLRSPVHLSGGDEKQIIKIFNLIDKKDVVFSTYRSHYHALLHGISEQWLKDWILGNKSIHVMNKEHKFWTSAIVGGTLPVALGTAMAIKLKQEYALKVQIKPENEELELREYPNRKVWCFIGDMTATTGVFWDCYNFAVRNDLPIIFVISDNGLSTDTPTKEVWGMKLTDKHWFEKPMPKIIYYKYTRTWPHYGTGKFVAKIWGGIDETKQKGF